jgi:putative RNA 2'-phosphotransferase
MRESLVSKSKFLSLVLRHDPGVIGLELDANGWASVSELLSKAAAHGTALSEDELKEIVTTNEKKRFDWDTVANRIRANQGHSIEVDLELSPAMPPEELFHGSAVQNQASIFAKGLVRGKRQHVHLSSDISTAKMVGARHGRPIVFRISSGEMHRQGHNFYISKNGVWLTGDIPPAFLRKIE